MKISLAKDPQKRLFSMLLIAFFLGAFWIFALRFVTLRQDEVHYHANFAVFVEGERLPFEKFTFYEEVEACGGNAKESPKIRAHMHDQINHVVHVHDYGSTWGHFFANLGYTLGNEVLITDEGEYIEGDEYDITFWRDGSEAAVLANQTIVDEEVVLISVNRRQSDVDLQQQYDQIERDASVYNEQDDPSACSGDDPLTLTNRFLIALGLKNQ